MKHHGKRLKNVTRLKNLFKNLLKLSHKTVLGEELKDPNVVKGNGDEAYSVTGVCVCEYVHQHTGEGKRLGCRAMTQWHRMNELFSCISYGCKFIVVRI